MDASLGVRPALGTSSTDLREILSKTSMPRPVAERAERREVRSDSRVQLVSKGMIFNEPEIAPFRDMLAKSGFLC